MCASGMRIMYTIGSSDCVTPGRLMYKDSSGPSRLFYPKKPNCLIPAAVVLQYRKLRVAMSTKLIAIVAGVGPGTGACVARKFAKKYPVVLLARNSDSYEGVAKDITSEGGKALGISTDISDSSSVKKAVETIKQEFGSDVGAAVRHTFYPVQLTQLT